MEEITGNIKNRFDVFTLDKLSEKFQKNWIIDNILSENSLSIIYGRAGCGKTSFILNLILSLSQKSIKKFADKNIKKYGKTLYITGEGVDGLYKRINSWSSYNDINKKDINTVFLPLSNIDINNYMTQSKFINTLVDVLSQNPDIFIIVIDTISNFNISENSSSSINNFVSLLRKNFNGKKISIILIHHSGKDINKGIRGSSNFLAIADTVFKLEKQNKENKGVCVNVKITIEKQKDGEYLPFVQKLYPNRDSIIMINDF